MIATEKLSMSECENLIKACLDTQLVQGAPILAAGMKKVMEPAREFMVESGITSNEEYDERYEGMGMGMGWGS